MGNENIDNESMVSSMNSQKIDAMLNPSQNNY